MSTTQRRATPARSAAASVLACGAALGGLAVSLYLTVEHYDGSVELACPENATINCAKVTTSSWSSIAGIPVALLGAVFFAAMTALLLLPSRARVVRDARLVGAGIGLLTVLWLVFVELFEVDAICLWCTAVHVLTLVLLGAVLWDRYAPDDQH